MMRMLLGVILSLYVVGASAADPSCATQATEKKLAGAAKTSFMGKCERDAKAACDAAAVDLPAHRPSYVSPGLHQSDQPS